MATIQSAVNQMFGSAASAITRTKALKYAKEGFGDIKGIKKAYAAQDKQIEAWAKKMAKENPDKSPEELLTPAIDVSKPSEPNPNLSEDWSLEVSAPIAVTEGQKRLEEQSVLMKAHEELKNRGWKEIRDMYKGGN